MREHENYSCARSLYFAAVTGGVAFSPVGAKAFEDKPTTKAEVVLHDLSRFFNGGAPSLELMD